MDILKKTQNQPKNKATKKLFFFQDAYFYGISKKKIREKSLKKFFGIFFLCLFLAVSATGIYFSWKIHSVNRSITIHSKNDKNPSLIQDIGTLVSSIIFKDHKKLFGEEEGRINILLLGATGKGNPGQNLTDTIMIMSIDTKNKKIGLLSLPRDFYANIPGTRYFTKINSIYQYGITNDQGIEPIKKTVENITDIKIHYFIIVDYGGFKKIIDDIGGINVMVERDIYDPRYPGPNYSYETFELKKGFHLLDGATALKYVRERHNDPEGDFGRAKRQQQIIQATKNRMFSLKTFFNIFALNNLLTTLGDSVKTDIRLEEIESFIALSKKVDTQNITNSVVDAWKKDSLLKVSHIATSQGLAFILIPRVGNYSEIRDLAKNLFNLDAIRRRQAEIQKEEAGILIVNRSGDNNLAYKIKRLFEDKLEMKNVRIGYDTQQMIQEKSYVFPETSLEKLFTLDEILKKLPAVIGQEKDILPEKISDTDIIVTLGSDLEKIYSFEEDNIDDLNSSANDNQKYFDIIEEK